MKIVIYCGDSWEAWSPLSLGRGIGGSEEAAVHMAAELSKLGHEVTVYNRCEDMAGTYSARRHSHFPDKEEGFVDFVTYRDYLDYEGEECDVFVGWRNVAPWKVAKNYRVGYHWLHDTTPEDQVMQALEMGAKKAMCLSLYHRRLYPDLLRSEVFMTRNGIDPSHFAPLSPTARVPYRIAYGSSYDRGLKDLLEMWPRIKTEIPEAELRIFYGWETVDRMIASGKKEMEAFKEHMEELMDQEGVTHLGRISHAEVAREFMSADVWAYPTWWPEISCITAMKAQAGGAIPCVIPTAAAAETCQFGAKTDRGFYQSVMGGTVEPSGAMDQFAHNLLTLLSRPMEEKEGYRKQMSEWALSGLSWQSVAKQWEEEFLNGLKEKDEE